MVSIDPQRSQGMMLALCQAPYRVFLNNDEQPDKTNPPNLVLYCLPPTVTEYLGFSQEASAVRAKLLDAGSNTVIAIYDSKSDGFIGADNSNVVLDAIGGNVEARAALAAASLSALSQLDVLASAQLAGPSKREDVVVVVGSGGREHALAVALAKSPLVKSVICCPGNGGTAVEGGKISNAEEVNGKQENATVLDLVKRVGAAMVVVGPEAPLVDGLVDEMAVAYPDVRVFGPTKAAAQLEASKVQNCVNVHVVVVSSSKLQQYSILTVVDSYVSSCQKAFTKDFLQEHDIPTAKYRNFTDAAEAIAYVESLDENDRQVVKASGLAAGKGVLLPTTKAETIDAVKEIMSDRAFGAAGDTCVIESFMTGPEASCLAFCDGKTAVLMPAAQDHKRALDNDMGLNTGGMGAYSPAPCVTPDLQKEIEAMCIKTVEKMAERGTPYVGVLYAGMM
jgi:phosphoribosylamine--glycine ligase/phosphoribosylglycinamide formyltransferase/phosphoribosylformylglycinamidine cyclo-ligase/phosphoribosylamine--glycine ligase/phosphoribosylformylglycinamidine cyclo-ligase